jgi:hypothetical protein
MIETVTLSEGYGRLVRLKMPAKAEFLDGSSRSILRRCLIADI